MSYERFDVHHVMFLYEGTPPPSPRRIPGKRQLTPLNRATNDMIVSCYLPLSNPARSIVEIETQPWQCTSSKSPHRTLLCASYPHLLLHHPSLLPHRLPTTSTDRFLHRGDQRKALSLARESKTYLIPPCARRPRNHARQNPQPSPPPQNPLHLPPLLLLDPPPEIHRRLHDHCPSDYLP